MSRGERSRGDSENARDTRGGFDIPRQVGPAHLVTDEMRAEGGALYGRSEVEVPAAMKPVLAATVSNLLIAAPSHAGVLFDFNLTLPIIAGQFLALMFVLDKLIYTPVGEVLDKRDGELRSKLAAVKDNSTELNALAVRL